MEINDTFIEECFVLIEEETHFSFTLSNMK